MKSHKHNKQMEKESNKIVISTIIAITALVLLYIINRGQNISNLVVITCNAALVLSVGMLLTAIAFFVFTAKKDRSFVEYALISLVSAVGYYILHGVSFLSIRYATYIMAAVYILYFIVAFIYHTFLTNKN